MNKERIILFTRGKYILAFSAVLVGSSLASVRAYMEKGEVTPVTIGASIFAMLLGTIIILVIGRKANQVEKPDE